MKLGNILAALGIGAGVMYFFDPRHGNRRRALVSDQVDSLLAKTDDAIDVTARDLRNRARGTLSEALAVVSEEEAPDWLLEERVRAEMGRSVRHPSAIDVTADNGRVILRGPILADEVDRMLDRVSSVRGVESIDNQLDVHQDADNIPALQGGVVERRVKPEWEQEYWSPSMRLFTGLGGGLMALYGLSKRGVGGMAMSAAGLALTARSITNKSIDKLVGIGDIKDAIRINKAINIDAPMDDLYQFMSNLENIPHVMAHVKEVKDLGNGRTHWKARGPAGVDIEWDAIKTNEIPNEEIAWESVAGEELQTTGKITFQENLEGGTRVTVHLGYTPPAGAVGHAFASIFGADAKKALDEDMVRLKSLFEEGKTTVDGREVSLQELSGFMA